jgi:hypothetical protein
MLSELVQTYRGQCADVENAARQQVQARQAREGDQPRTEKIAELAGRRTQATVEDERCFELLRILHAKRQHAAGMTEGQRADLQRSELACQQRCKRS